MKRIMTIAIISILLLVGSFLYLMYRLGAEPKLNVGTLPTGIVSVEGREIMVEIASDMSSQVLGLSYRESMAEDRGMIFVYDEPRTQRFWMKGMKFPIDILFIQGDRVMQVVSDVPPPNGGLPKVVTSRAKVDKVLEINAGKAEEWGIVEGAIVKLN
ncbi:hypothetical protein GF380_03175 [Candidatus Uhrbacteria bacterium]|nr:hypothetical protein [Candidatus Uhrbacteria bacterium]MBD3284144.1 hypothetical protein [Candidatus Uhrbacteria bacterium]